MGESPVGEEEIIRRCQQGDRQAFDELLGKYEKLIYNLTYRYFGNHDDASDVGQEAMVRVFRKIGDFNGNSSFKTWLYRVVSNLCLDEIRRRKQHLTSLDEIKEQGFEPVATDPSPGEAVESMERASMVQEVLGLLSEEHRAILILKDIEGLDYNEIAVVLGCNIGTVKSRLSRARDSFRRKMTERPRYCILMEGRVQA
jgi:RNA polymerase sigma-70 factor (ECF subfamily)